MLLYWVFKILLFRATSFAFPEPQTIELIDARDVIITLSGGNGGSTELPNIFPGGRARGRFEYLPGQTGINGFLRFEPGSEVVFGNIHWYW